MTAVRTDEATTRQQSPARPRRRTRRQAALVALAYLALALVGFSMLLPFLWMVSTSLKAPAYAIEFPPRWIPSEPATIEITGQTYPVDEVKGEPGVRVAVLRYSPAGAQAQVLAPSAQAGQTRVIPEAQLVPVRAVRLH